MMNAWVIWERFDCMAHKIDRPLWDLIRKRRALDPIHDLPFMCACLTKFYDDKTDVKIIAKDANELWGESNFRVLVTSVEKYLAFVKHDLESNGHLPKNGESEGGGGNDSINATEAL